MSTCAVQPAFGSVSEAGIFAGVSARTVHRLLSDKKLRRYRLGKRVLVNLSELEHLVRATADGRDETPIPQSGGSRRGEVS